MVRAALVLAVVGGCVSAAAAPKPVREVTTPPPAASPFPISECGAGHLPRITERTVGADGIRGFLAVAAKGSVAAVWDGKRARLVDGCHLDGRYTEARGEPGGGRFFATNRVMFRVDEIPAACGEATHVVAAYVTSRPGGAGAAGADTPPTQLDGVLVPLPCPPTSSREPAKGCLGVGLTGPQRRQKAEGLMNQLDTGVVKLTDVAQRLEIFALAPDESREIEYGSWTDMGDCALGEQGHWLGAQYITVDRGDLQVRAVLQDRAIRRPPPRLDWTARDCHEMPVFLACFGDRFIPVFFGAHQWQPPLEKRQ